MMKNAFFFGPLAFFCVLTAALLFPSCQSDHAMNTADFSYADSTRYIQFSSNIEFPLDTRGPQEKIRRKMLGVIAEALGVSGIDGSQEQIFDQLRRASHDNMMSYHADALKEAAEGFDLFPWEKDIRINLIEDSPRYAVFQYWTYSYMGGAHGGISDKNYTFNKKDGSMVESFLRPECLNDMQPLLREGLVRYFKEGGTDVNVRTLDDWLFLEEDRIIPYPQQPPFPSKDGLLFTYQQYEIAAYAAGMPSFVLSYKDVSPYLTPEAKALFE